MPKIAVLTGGGDVPGLNACIKAIVFRAAEHGFDVIGFRRGWAGLVFCNPEDPDSIRQWTQPLNQEIVRTIDRSGGTFLHTSRTNPSRFRVEALPEHLQSFRPDGMETADLTQHVKRVLETLEVEALIPIGGDDTLSYSHRLHGEGFSVVAVPKTMDNDVYGTDYCIGFSTAITRSVEYINQLRTSIGSHERVGIVELFGRNSGETSLFAAYLASADRAIISEVPFDGQKLARFLHQDKRRNASNYAVMTISEGARMVGRGVLESGEADAYGHRKLGGIGLQTAKLIKKLSGENIIYQQVAYLMRSGIPDALDLMVATNYGTHAVDLIARQETGRMLAVSGGRYTHKDIDVVTQGLKRVDVDKLYDRQNYRPKVRNLLNLPMFLH